MSKNKELTITQDKIYGSIYLEMKWIKWLMKLVNNLVF
jgi:hypothetical protein